MIDKNLTLADYGVTLRRLTHDKIEMLRQWRNDPKIQQFMVYQEYITPEMQEKWFERINNNNNFYFIIEYADREVGMINIKDVDYEKKTGENGVFIFEDKYRSTDLSYRSFLVMYDWIFIANCFIDSAYAHVQRINTSSIRLGEFLGSKTILELSTEKLLYTLIKRDDYINNENRYRFLKRWFFFNNNKQN